METSAVKIIGLIIVTVIIGIITAERCERIKIGKDYYKRHLAATIDGYPTGMVVDPVTENIYFRLYRKNYTKGIYVLKFGSLGIKQLIISDEFVGQCVGIDAVNNVIYVGSNQGLLIYDPTKNVVNTDRPIGDDDIRSIFFDKKYNQMYITVGETHDLYKFLNGSAAVRRFDKIPKAYNFVQDTIGNIFYEYIDGRLYFFSVDYFEPVQYKGFTKELKYIINLNNQNEAIVAVKDSLYKLDIDSILPTKIADLGFKITGMAFDDKSNIIIGAKGKIYRYKLVDNNEPCPPDDYFMTNI